MVFFGIYLFMYVFIYVLHPISGCGRNFLNIHSLFMGRSQGFKNPRQDLLSNLQLPGASGVSMVAFLILDHHVWWSQILIFLQDININLNEETHR